MPLRPCVRPCMCADGPGCVCARVCARVRACVCVCVRACVCASMLEPLMTGHHARWVVDFFHTYVRDVYEPAIQCAPCIGDIAACNGDRAMPTISRQHLLHPMASPLCSHRFKHWVYNGISQIDFAIQFWNFVVCRVVEMHIADAPGFHIPIRETTIIE